MTIANSKKKYFFIFLFNLIFNLIFIIFFFFKNSFMNSIDKFSDENYVPTDQDILHARSKTAGISEINFTANDVNLK